MFAAIPLLSLPVLLYNVFVLAVVAKFPDSAAAHLDQPLFTIAMASHAAWTVRTGDLFMLLGLVTLFMELLRATQSGRVAIIHHSLTMLLFIICLVEFLLARTCASSTFFLLTAMVLLNVLAGFVVSLSAAHRE